MFVSLLAGTAGRVVADLLEAVAALPSVSHGRDEGVGGAELLGGEPFSFLAIHHRFSYVRGGPSVGLPMLLPPRPLNIFGRLCVDVEKGLVAMLSKLE